MRKFERTSKENPQEPTKEQLERYKDFASLSHSYERLTKKPKKPLYRDPKLFIFLLLLGIIALLLFLEN